MPGSGMKDGLKNERHTWFGLEQPFDPNFRLVTSGIVGPKTLFGIRLFVAVYCVTVSVVHIILFIGPSQHLPAERYYIFFTRLTFIGITSYFCAGAFHTGVYVKFLRRTEFKGVQNQPWYPLQRWGQTLQFLHLYLLSSILVFPVMVTIMHWTILEHGQAFDTPFNAWSNISFHILNCVLTLVELVFGRACLHWGYLPCILLNLGLYLAMTWVVHATQGIFGNLPRSRSSKGKGTSYWCLPRHPSCGVRHLCNHAWSHLSTYPDISSGTMRVALPN